jgi:acetylornithine/succinyldiaminopimelate/putrescine aminotransferase
VLPLPDGFLAEVRAICDERDVLLILDEVQVGLGRTGTLWAHESMGVEPDIMTIAKPLAGGLPMGAVLLKEHVARMIQPGDHATTFGGGPLVASAALAVCRKVGSPEFLAEVRRKGELLGERLAALALRKGNVVAVRGMGLIWGIEVTVPAGDVVAAGLQAGLLLVGAGANVVRIVPPLSIDESDLVRGLAILEELL